jgi:hypothetical protein
MGKNAALLLTKNAGGIETAKEADSTKLENYSIVSLKKLD